MAVAVDAGRQVFLEGGAVDFSVGTFCSKEGAGSIHQRLGLTWRIGQGVLTPANDSRSKSLNCY
jgi:hypothetical protein